MSTWWATAVLMTAALSSPSSNIQPSTRSPNEPLAAVGVGAGPCSKFTRIDKLDPKWAKDTFMSWAQGFMAGSNSERGDQKKVSVNVNAMSDDAQWANLEAYCSDHPDEPFALGVMILYLSLPTESRTQ